MTSRVEARQLGESHYFTGKPCKRGHISERRVDNSTCVDCVSERNKEYYSDNKGREKERSRAYKQENKERTAYNRKAYVIANREKIRAMARDYYRRNSEKVLQSCREWSDRNKEKVRAAQKAYREKNKEALKEKNRAKYRRRIAAIRARSKKYREENQEKIIAQKRAWYGKNKHMVRAAGWRRKARIKKAKGSFTGQQIAGLLATQKNKCAACLVCVSDGYEIDHILPLYLNGSNDIKNIQILCRTCNRSKWAKHPVDWAQENGRLL